MFFLVIINDLPDVIMVKLFAGDAKLYAAVSHHNENRVQ